MYQVLMDFWFLFSCTFPKPKHRRRRGLEVFCFFFPCPRLTTLERRKNHTFYPSPPLLPESPVHAPGAAGAMTVQNRLKLTPSLSRVKVIQRSVKQPDLRDNSYQHADPRHCKPASNFQRNFSFFHGNGPWESGCWRRRVNHNCKASAPFTTFTAWMEAENHHQETQRYLLVGAWVTRSLHPQLERCGDFHTCDAVVTTGTLRKTKSSLNIPASLPRHPRANS